MIKARTKSSQILIEEMNPTKIIAPTVCENNPKWCEKRMTNKDTLKAVNAATTLIKYCVRYKKCDKCIFHSEFGGCAVNKPFDYQEIDMKGGAE